MERVIIWDFDGTLAQGTGGWSGAIADVLRSDGVTGVTIEQIRAHLKEGFPWQTPEIDHRQWNTADLWWQAVAPAFGRALCAVGIELTRAGELAKQVRESYVNPASFHVYHDSVPALAALTARGWKHVLFSNHVPELEEIVAGIGLSGHISRVFNSAVIGYEKPHPEAFAHVLRELGRGKAMWMIGDSMTADIDGASAAGIPSILVHKPHPRAGRFCTTLTEVLGIIIDQ